MSKPIPRPPVQSRPMELKFPDADLYAHDVKNDRYDQAAAVCRPGHLADADVDPNMSGWQGASNCPTCGARVLVGCETSNDGGPATPLRQRSSTGTTAMPRLHGLNAWRTPC